MAVKLQKTILCNTTYQPDVTFQNSKWSPLKETVNILDSLT